TALTFRSAGSSDSGAVRSPATTSTVAGSLAAAGWRVSARTGTPAASNWPTTSRPTRPVAPVTRTGSTRVTRVSLGAASRVWYCRTRRLIFQQRPDGDESKSPLPAGGEDVRERANAARGIAYPVVKDDDGACA